MTENNQKITSKKKEQHFSFLLELCGETTECDNCGVFQLSQKKNSFQPLLMQKTLNTFYHKIKSLWEKENLLERLNNKKTFLLGKDETIFVAPLWIGDELFGFFACFYPAKSPNDVNQKKLILFSKQIKVCLENLRLKDKMKSKEKIIETWQKEMLLMKRKASVGELTRDFAHDINNPLQIVLGKAQILAMRMKKEEMDKKYVGEVESIERNAQRISCLIKQLSDFAKRSEDNPVSSSDVNLNHLLERTFLLVQRKFKFKGIDFQIKSPEKLPSVKGNPSLLEQVLLDLFLNAQESIPQGGKLTVNLKKEKDFLKLDFGDTGEKISEELLPGVFDPLSLTRDSKKKLPYGILLSSQIIRDHKGKMEILSNKDKGNVFRLKLPIIK